MCIRDSPKPHLIKNKREYLNSLFDKTNMNKEHHLKLRRHFALACPGLFFTLTFWSLSLLMGTATYFLVSESYQISSGLLSHLISSLPFSSISVESSPKCPDNSHLLFSWEIPGVSESSCHRSLSTSPYIEVANGWWKCKSGLYSGFQMLDQTNSTIAWNLGQKFVCVEKVDLDFQDFEYVETTSSGLDSSSFSGKSITLG